MLTFIIFQTIPIIQRLSDGGPKYTETNLDHFIVEPYNAASALLFLGIASYWFWKIKGDFERHQFITIGLPILLIGGIGGTIYHAFRVSRVFLIMDWLPILILCLLSSGYFLYKYSGKWSVIVLYIVGMFALQSLNRVIIPLPYIINTSYALMALMVLIPVGLMLYKTQFSRGKWILFAFLAFGAALFFRIADHWGWLPMGTHFLWHTFGALACHLVIKYIYELK